VTFDSRDFEELENTDPTLPFIYINQFPNERFFPPPSTQNTDRPTSHNRGE